MAHSLEIYHIIGFTQIGEGETADLNEESIWELALRRFVVRVNAVSYGFRLRLVTSEARGQKPPSPASVNNLLEPLALLDAQGALTWLPSLATKLKSLGIEGVQPQAHEHAEKKAALPPIKVIKQSVTENNSENTLSIPPLLNIWDG